MAAALAAESSSIFDILNLYIHGSPKAPNPDRSHRYYICQEPPSSNRMGPMTCEQVNYVRVMEFLKKKETTPMTDVMVPIERTSPRPLDQAILSYKLWAPVVISPSS